MVLVHDEIYFQNSKRPNRGKSRTSKFLTSIHSLTSSLLASKTYIIDANPDSVIIIDPGDPDTSELIDFLKARGKKNIKVLLTHEHADHCAGLNSLYRFQPFELICTRVAAERIADQKLNLSKYFGNINPFEVNLPATIVADFESITIFDNVFTFIETPGHSPGGTCFFFNDAVFTGDTLLNKSKTPLGLPYSNKKIYLESILKLQKYMHTGMTIYPGHGESFIWNNDVKLL